MKLIILVLMIGLMGCGRADTGSATAPAGGFTAETVCGYTFNVFPDGRVMNQIGATVPNGTYYQPLSDGHELCTYTVGDGNVCEGSEPCPQ